MRRLRSSTSGGSESPRPTVVGGVISAQEDAMEFMTFVLDAIHEEMLPYTSALSSSSGDSDGTYSVTAAMTAARVADEDGGGWEEVSSSRIASRGKTNVDEESRRSALAATESTPISRLCHGILRSEYKQQGKTISATFQRFHCLTLECRDFGFVGTKSVVKPIPSLEKAMEVFFSPEKITDSNSVFKSSFYIPNNDGNNIQRGVQDLKYILFSRCRSNA